jgi:uncharacterized membrane protein (DUF485 family)
MTTVFNRITQGHAMNDEMLDQIQANPKFTELVHKRRVLGWTLSIIMLAIYFGFILLVAFSPETLGQRIGDGATTIGIPLGIGVIIAAIVLTGIYVRTANSTFDQLNNDVVREALK